uniref:Uncharacterized protein n=1 Tax=Oryzias latipes TaxID=8090 RepID=A0A3B3IFU8_ORYLA
MGGSPSVQIPGGGSEGYHVLKVRQGGSELQSRRRRTSVEGCFGETHGSQMTVRQSALRAQIGIIVRLF